MSTGKKIRRERRDQELSQRELAETAGLALNTVSLIERGLRTPSVTTVARIARALGVEPGELIEEPAFVGKEDAPMSSPGRAIKRDFTDNVAAKDVVDETDVRIHIGEFSELLREKGVDEDTVDMVVGVAKQVARQQQR
jgi:transcriptional regulator with XRE-family HTH domain